MQNFLQRCLIRAIDAYQFLVSPWTYGCCRFFPTCSVYAKQAIHHHGVLAGCLLTIKRLLKCHPGCNGGVDEVPPFAFSRKRKLGARNTETMRH